MLKNINIVIILSLSLHICAQDTTYFKINLHEESRNSWQLTKYEDRYFVLNTGVCNLTTECSSVMEMDLNGDIIWEKELQWLDVGSKSMTIHEDTITLSGNKPGNVGFYLHQMSTEGGDSITTYTINDIDSSFDRMYQLVNIRHNGQYLMGSRGVKNDSMYALIWAINPNGSLDTLVSPIQMDSRAVIWDMYIDSEGFLTVHLSLNSEEGGNSRMIIKCDDQFNIVWSYTTEELITGGFSSPRGCELQDGRTVFVYDIDHINAFMNSVQTVNLDSTISWWYQWPDFSGNDARSIFKLKTLESGDIIGVGQYRDSSYDPRIADSPFIFKLSSEGEMLWQHIFTEVDPNNSEQTVYGFLSDVHELENGYLLAVGGWRGQVENFRADPIIVLMDNEGCVISGCGELIPTSTEEEIAAFNNRINIFPNPLGGHDLLNINIEQGLNGFETFVLKTYDFQGRLLQQFDIQSGQNQVDFSNYPQGVYLLVLEKNGVMMASEKVVK